MSVTWITSTLASRVLTPTSISASLLLTVRTTVLARREESPALSPSQERVHSASAFNSSPRGTLTRTLTSLSPTRPGPSTEPSLILSAMRTGPTIATMTQPQRASTSRVSRKTLTTPRITPLSCYTSAPTTQPVLTPHLASGRKFSRLSNASSSSLHLTVLIRALPVVTSRRIASLSNSSLSTATT